MKRVFGLFEAVFDTLYLIAAITIGLVLLFTGHNDQVRMLSGIMALVLGCGDAFHLLPRIQVIRTHKEEKLRPLLGRGKQITSITMTLFYILLWHLGILVFSPANIAGWTYTLYILAIVRILLCFLPQNRWLDRFPPVEFAILRNLPFFLMGLMTAVLYFTNQHMSPGLGFMWLAVIISFGCYLPVILWSNRNPKLGMLMLPKTCAYLWMLILCLSL